MNGLLLINKEQGMTSHDVVAKVRRLLNTKRIGHLGTLDPNATGVLVLCIGEACKLVPFLENDNKEYIAEVILGIDTNTYDITGEIVKSKDVDIEKINLSEILTSFLGQQQQLPPIYSAIKVNGKKLYQYARNDENVEIKPRDIIINSIEYVEPVKYENGYNRFKIKVDVSKGTYIRSLCHDIGIKLGCYATMGELIRTRSGKFCISDAIKISDLSLENIELISMLDAIDYPKVEITTEDMLKKITNGMNITLNNFEESSLVAFTYNQRLLAIYEQRGKEMVARRVWN